MPKTLTARTKVVVLKERKPQLCLMNPWSCCGEIVTPRHRRGLCDNDYQNLWLLVSQSGVRWEELEDAGMCLPPRRDVQKRVLTVIVARRKSV